MNEAFWAGPAIRHVASRRESAVVTRKDLRSKASAVYEHLASAGIKAGARVVLVTPSSIHLFPILFATWALDATTCVLPPHAPRGRSTDALITQLASTIVHFRADLVISTGDLLQVLARALDGRGCQFASLDALLALPSSSRGVTLDWSSSRIAHVQYTSGTTGAPKGVPLSLAVMSDHVDRIGDRIGVRDADVFVSWLPHHHDMGFISTMCALLWRVPLEQIPTDTYARDPRVWLHRIRESGGSLSPAPPFAFAAAAKQLGVRARTTDLSTLRYAWIGGDYVAPSMIERLLAVGESVGLKRSSLAPCYGLAEAVLAVTLPVAGEGPRTLVTDARQHSLLGSPIDGAQLKLADDGEILVRGPNAIGAVFDPSKPNAELHTTNRWLPTGDLGLVHGGQLAVLGRKKDVIMVGGRCVDPAWIEDCLGLALRERQGGGAAPRCAALAVEQPNEGTRRVLIYEASDAMGTPPDDVRALAAELCDVSFHEAHPVPRGSLPLTTSGKLLRRACLDLLEVPDEQQAT